MTKTVTVVAITPNTIFTSSQGKAFKITEFVYKDSDSKVNSQRVFPTAPFFKFVNSLKSGDAVELTLEKEDGYWRLKNVTAAGASSAGAVTTTTQMSNSATGALSKGGSMQNEEIRRSVALKASVEMRISDETIDDILRRAVVFEDYLAGKYEFLNKVEEMSENFVDDVGVE